MIVLLVLTLISGVLAASEIAVSSSNRNKVKLLADAGDKRAKRLLATLDEPNSFFATTQLYYTFIAFFCGAFAASVFTTPLVDCARWLGLPISENVAEPIAFILVTAILTYVSLILGELVPKRVAMRYAIPIALRILPVLYVLSILALPFVKALSVSAKFVLRLIRFQDENPEDLITKEEICLIVETSGEQGQIDESEQDMIENIIKADQLTAGDICTHRLDIVALPLNADFQTVLSMCSGEYYTRMPIYEESLDNVCGILYTKDVLRYMASRPDVGSPDAGSPDFSGFEIKTLMREASFVPFSKKADELFQEMREERIYMAVVVDEYGGTMGIITMEDLVERIVGKIHDEYDIDEQPDIVSIDEQTFLIQGTTCLEAVQDHFGTPFPLNDYETLSGFLVGLLGYIPSEGEKPEVVFNGLLFKIESLQDKRIATVKVTPCAPPSTAFPAIPAPGTVIPTPATPR